MAQIIVAGLGENQKIHLVRSRKPEGTLKAGEYIHKNKSGEVVAYRKNLPVQDNGSPKPIAGVKLNKLIVKEWDNSTTGKTWSFSIAVSNQTGSHRIDMGSGMLASSVANSLCSLLNKSKEELENMTFSFSFYCNKKGYNTCYIVDGQGNPLDWYMSPEEVQSLIKKAPNPLKPEEILSDKEPLMKRYMELAEALNELLPHSNYDSGSALDGIDDDDVSVSSLTESDAEEVFTEKPKTNTQVPDIPFE